jgi:putative endonuclease
MSRAVFSLYILRCADQTLYTGIATDVRRRLAEHESGTRGAKYLRGKGPLELALVREVGDRATASVLEHRVKRLTRRQKEALIDGRRSIADLLADQVSGDGRA